jgi:hypothetical protein
VPYPITGKPYDALNRPYGFSYTTAPGNPANVAATPQVTFTYDQGCACDAGFKGALSTVSVTGSSTCISRDGFGRIKKSIQTTAGTAYPFSYSYSLTDQLSSNQRETEPACLVVDLVRTGTPVLRADVDDLSLEPDGGL